MRGKFTVTIIASILILGSFTPILSVKDVFASTEVAKITASDAAADDWFGNKVALSGDKIIVGVARNDDAGLSSGSAYIFEKDSSGGWVEVAKLTASDAAAGDSFGGSVSISGDRVVVGSSADDDFGAESGSAYIFERDPSTGTWTEVAKITSSDAAAGDSFGVSVSISEDMVIVGANGNDDFISRSGAAYIFERDASTGTWTEVVKLLPSISFGNGFFGSSVSISDDAVVVGAHGESSFRGAAYVFEQDPSTGIWTQTARLFPSVFASFALFGQTASISGDTIIVGASSTPPTGSAFVFEKNTSGSWAETARLTPSSGPTFHFGSSVSVYDDTAIVGANNEGSSRGAAYIFEVDSSGSWVEVEKITASDAAVGDQFGVDVSLSGRTAVVGAAFNDDVCPTDINCNSGSAYVFSVLPPDTTPPIITLLGSEIVNLEVGDVYVDAGATALDDVDGDITPDIITVNPVDTSTLGTYLVTYDVSDAAGNAAVQATRTVNVFSDIIDSNTNDNVDVDAGQIVLITDGAEVDGNIKVDGGTLILENGCTIDGNVEAKNGGTISITSCTINGNVKTKDSQSVSVSDSIVGGNIDSKDDQTISVVNTSVNGNLNVKGSNTATTVGNSVNGNLDLKDNGSVTSTGNNVNGNLKIKGTGGSCTDTANTVSGNFDGCP